ADSPSSAGGALRHAGRVRSLSRRRARARLSRVRVRAAGALELSRRAGARAQQRRAGQFGPGRAAVTGSAVASAAVECAAGGPRGLPARQLRQLGLVPYEPTWRAMQRLTDERGPHTPDEIWFLEHPPVFTLGMSGERAHLLAPGEIPVVQTDRGGQVT